MAIVRIEFRMDKKVEFSLLLVSSMHKSIVNDYIFG